MAVAMVEAGEGDVEAPPPSPPLSGPPVPPITISPLPLQPPPPAEAGDGDDAGLVEGLGPLPSSATATSATATDAAGLLVGLGPLPPSSPATAGPAGLRPRPDDHVGRWDMVLPGVVASRTEEAWCETGGVVAA